MFEFRFNYLVSFYGFFGALLCHLFCARHLQDTDGLKAPEKWQLTVSIQEATDAGKF